MNFSAVILAGGKSSRMGRDKALLEISGQTLLARQIEIVRAAGAVEVFISGRADVDYSAFEGRLLQDNFPEAGPLAGIESALAAANNPLLLVLAVDLLAMNADFLRRLMTHCSANSGAVPRVAGDIEPLVACYPKTAHPLAVQMLGRNQCAVKYFAGAVVSSGLAVWLDLTESDRQLFKNGNRPADLPSA